MKICLPQCRQLYVSCTAAVPLYIAALSLYCHSAARPIRARARTLSIYKYILQHCDRHNFMLLTSLNYKYFQVWKIVSTFALSNLS